ncbi:MAG: transketolase-like TK C-terminal-containing protein, partial [Acidimicrobiales bacterium]
IESGLARMFGENPENVYFYITIYNEPYMQPPEPENFDPEGLLRGIYRYRAATQRRANKAALLASGVAMPSALAAAEMLAADWDVAADEWSDTSWNELNRDGVAVEKEKLRHPDRPAGVPYVTQALEGAIGPVIAVSDWMRAVPEQIRPWVPGTYVTLGTDGFGFSDTRPAARRYFNTDAESQVVAVLEALARDGAIDPSVPVAAARQYKIDEVQAPPAQTSDSGLGA